MYNSLNEDMDTHLEYLQDNRLTVKEWFYLQENCDYSY